MSMENLLILCVVAAIVALAGIYVVKAKKRGSKCIGCPGGCSGQCSAGCDCFQK